jgi:hypothetical protein
MNSILAFFIFKLVFLIIELFEVLFLGVYAKTMTATAQGKDQLWYIWQVPDFQNC